MIKKILILFTCCFSMHNLNAQSKTDVEDVFKMQLFLNKRNISRSDLKKTIIKNDSLYKSFRENSLLEIDTLELKSNIYLPIEGSFEFFRIKDVEYKDRSSANESWYLKVDLSLDTKYVIAINKTTGRSYRLAGFNGNDFHVFFSDISMVYKSFNFKKLKISKFLREYKVEGLDFECLHEGIKKDIIDKDKFPCLKTCSDTYSVHSR